jgi:hypothetical protein
MRELKNKVKLCYVCGDIRDEFHEQTGKHVDYSCTYFENNCGIGECKFLSGRICKNNKAIFEFKRLAKE